MRSDKTASFPSILCKRSNQERDLLEESEEETNHKNNEIENFEEGVQIKRVKRN